MKITIDIDCTPEEARSFLGLPPIEAMQAAVVDKLQERLTQSLDALDPEALIKLWLPQGLEGLGKLQEGLFGQWMAAMGRASDRKGGPDEGGKQP